MGLFCIEKSDDPSELIKAAVRNIELFLEENGSELKCSYLLREFAMRQLKQSLEEITYSKQ
jgi:hypothetical protein